MCSVLPYIFPIPRNEKYDSRHARSRNNQRKYLKSAMAATLYTPWATRSIPRLKIIEWQVVLFLSLLRIHVMCVHVGKYMSFSMLQSRGGTLKNACDAGDTMRLGQRSEREILFYGREFRTLSSEDARFHFSGAGGRREMWESWRSDFVRLASLYRLPGRRDVRF